MLNPNVFVCITNSECQEVCNNSNSTLSAEKSTKSPGTTADKPRTKLSVKCRVLQALNTSRYLKLKRFLCNCLCLRKNGWNVDLVELVVVTYSGALIQSAVSLQNPVKLDLWDLDSHILSFYNETLKTQRVSTQAELLKTSPSQSNHDTLLFDDQWNQWFHSPYSTFHNLHDPRFNPTPWFHKLRWRMKVQRSCWRRKGIGFKINNLWF